MLFKNIFVQTFEEKRSETKILRPNGSIDIFVWSTQYEIQDLPILFKIQNDFTDFTKKFKPRTGNLPQFLTTMSDGYNSGDNTQK